MGKADLVQIGKTEPAILRQELVKVGRAATPVAENEKRRFDCDLIEQRAKFSKFDRSPKGILQALKCDCRGPRQTGNMDPQSWGLQEAEPLTEGNTSQ